MNKENLKKLLSELYDLNSSEIQILFFVYEKNSPTINDVSKGVGKDRTTASRILNKLYSLSLVDRESRCCTRGRRGRYFVYHSRRNIRQVLMDKLDYKYSSLKGMIPKKL